MPHLATKTLAAIEAAIVADQGAKFRGFEGLVFPHMGDAYRSEPEEGFRSHLGASLLGGKCARALWYGFRWYTKAKFGGRTLRLFNRGHLEEARFIAMLLTIGCTVYQQDANGNQFRISELGGHLGGSGDGVAIGVPDVPAGQPCLLEFKTHGDTSFKKLKKEGMRSAKFEHYVQMNAYMRKMGIPVGLYMAVNKNDDELYAEIVPMESALADEMLDRGRKVIMMREAPAKLNNSPGWFDCQWCDHKPVCHLSHPPERNCRTCKHSYAYEDGTWRCQQPTQPNGDGANVLLDKVAQLAGCPDYEVQR
jgi:hypothetical protein